jgi:hypothetical protein
MPTTPPKLLDYAHEVLRARHYAYLTEQSYIGLMRRFILFHQKRHPRNMGASRSRGLSVRQAPGGWELTNPFHPPSPMPLPAPTAMVQPGFPCVGRRVVCRE